MRLIDAEHLKWNVGGIKCGTLTVDYLNWILEHEEPTVDAIPISFIKEQIDKLQGIADYEFIESGGYLGECNHELRALQDLLKHWAERKEE